MVNQAASVQQRKNTIVTSIDPAVLCSWYVQGNQYCDNLQRLKSRLRHFQLLQHEVVNQLTFSTNNRISGPVDRRRDY